MTTPPAEVSLATSAQVPPGGGLAVVTMILSSAAAVLVPAPSSLFLLQAASATAAKLHARRVRTFIQLLRLIAGIGSSSLPSDGGPLLAAICAASDFRQWRSSGSAISRRPS